MQYLGKIRSKLKTLNSSISLSGGWVYHRKHALNFKRWRTFRTEVDQWLRSTVMHTSDTPLLLVGPSAGYSLSDGFLSSYSQIDAIELDPLSPYLWSLRHTVKITTWMDTNYFLLNDPFSRLRENYPHHLVLFSNLLGQLAYSHDFNAAIIDYWARDLSKLKNWMSYHDLYSLHGDTKTLSKFASAFQSPLTRQDVLALLLPWRAKLEILDHRTQDFVPSPTTNKYFLWRIDKNSLHIVEGVSNSC